MCARLQLQLQRAKQPLQTKHTRQRLSRPNHAHAHEISRINYSNLISFKYTHPLGCSTARHVCMFVPPSPYEKLENLCSKVFATSSGCFGGGRGEGVLSCPRRYNSRQKLLPIKIVGWALILCHDALGSTHSPRPLSFNLSNVPCDKVASAALYLGRRKGAGPACLLYRQFSVSSRTK